jgi:hypothetical protein
MARSFHEPEAEGTARANSRGVAAIEFAFIAPLLLTLYFVTMEVAPAHRRQQEGRAARPPWSPTSSRNSSQNTNRTEARGDHGDRRGHPAAPTTVHQPRGLSSPRSRSPTTTHAEGCRRSGPARWWTACSPRTPPKDAVTTVPAALHDQGITFLVRVTSPSSIIASRSSPGPPNRRRLHGPRWRRSTTST